MIRSDSPLSALAPVAVTPGPAKVAKSPVGAVAPSSTPVEPTRAEVEQAVTQANKQMSAVAPSLQFEIDPETEQLVIRLVDRQDQRVLRQVPSPEMLAIARALERMQALLVRTRA